MDHPDLQYILFTNKGFYYALLKAGDYQWNTKPGFIKWERVDNGERGYVTKHSIEQQIIKFLKVGGKRMEKVFIDGLSFALPLLIMAVGAIYSEKSGVLNDAFFVSGYSGNKENSVSTAQVRIEGSFKVADLDPYDNLRMNGDDEQNLTDQQLQDRLDNRIYYTVTVKKEVPFDWLYTYTDDQGQEHTVQLYDADNKN